MRSVRYRSNGTSRSVAGATLIDKALENCVDESHDTELSCSVFRGSIHKFQAAPMVVAAQHYVPATVALTHSLQR
jgi:hypothetical protein